MKKLNFNEIEEIVRLIDLSKSIPGLECKCMVKFDKNESIHFFYRENDLEYFFFVTPIFRKGKVHHYRLFDKVSLLIKESLAYGTYDNFPFRKYFDLDGGLLNPKEVSYDEVAKAILNIDMGDAYYPQKNF